MNGYKLMADSYCRKALKNASVGEETETAVMQQLHYLLDDKTAKEVCNDC